MWNHAGSCLATSGGITFAAHLTRYFFAVLSILCIAGGRFFIMGFQVWRNMSIRASGWTTGVFCACFAISAWAKWAQGGRFSRGGVVSFLPLRLGRTVLLGLLGFCCCYPI